uniref:uncharacterized protein LOC120820745 n=1 Tax=Gasterosteus aculeatus aculeatus TaxID=481459 RepID=UPI001A9A0F51|nr:uncharacterized protein LOC120820745 [Gasterosteus aculeatus aculeatus]
MSDPEIQNQPLLAATSQPAVNAQGGRPSRAHKVAGLTLLACVLIAGQVATTYLVLSQRSDIKSLEDQSKNLQSRLSVSRSGSGGAASVPMRMPMNAFPKVLDVVDEEASTEVTDKTVPQHATDCQLEAAGRKPLQVPGFRPACDGRGLYRAQQCFLGSCWCVNPADGQQVPASSGGRCGASVPIDSFSKLLTLPDLDEAESASPRA